MSKLDDFRKKQEDKKLEEQAKLIGKKAFTYKAFKNEEDRKTCYIDYLYRFYKAKAENKKLNKAYLSKIVNSVYNDFNDKNLKWYNMSSLDAPISKNVNSDNNTTYGDTIPDKTAIKLLNRVNRFLLNKHTHDYDLTNTIKERQFDREEVYYWLGYFLDHLEDDKNNKYSAQLKRELLLCDRTKGNTVKDIAERYDRNPQTLHSKKHKLTEELKDFYRKLGFKVLD